MARQRLRMSGWHAAVDEIGCAFAHVVASAILLKEHPRPGALPADGMEEASGSRRGDAQGDARLDGTQAVVPATEPAVVYEYDAELIERKCAPHRLPNAALQALTLHESRLVLLRHSAFSEAILAHACLEMPIHRLWQLAGFTWQGQ